MTRVFVYGTLLAGEFNHRVLAGARFVCEARTQPEFCMYSLGGFPAVTAGSAVIVGELYDVDADVLARLDQLEGHPRFYQRTPIVLDDGSSAETYLMRAERLAGRAVIESGSWRERNYGT